jgi:hypothetical protein
MCIASGMSIAGRGFYNVWLARLQGISFIGALFVVRCSSIRSNDGMLRYFML